MQIQDSKLMESFSYTDLIYAVRMMNSSRNAEGNINKTKNFCSELTLLSNQFYHIVSFPKFTLDYISENIQKLTGYTQQQMDLKTYYNLIHPEDLPLILLASKKLIEFMVRNLHQLEPLQIIVTFDYRIKNRNGNYIRILSQHGMISKDEQNGTCKTMSLHSDITNFKTCNKINFDLINYGSPIDFIFPDDELNNISMQFTPREREVLSLLAIGKNSIEIGDQLLISKHTVDTHRRHMLSKAQLCNTAELVAFAVNNNLF